MKSEALIDLENRIAVLAGRSRDTRAENRAAMPQTAAFVDLVRQRCGAAPKWGRFTENGRTVEFGVRPEWADHPSFPILPPPGKPGNARKPGKTGAGRAKGRPR
jgi:hypothetical protein